MATVNDPPAIMDRPIRATRGKRMSKLLDEELETDEQFWGQDAFREEENDVLYQDEGEVADEFDSDFDDDEPEPDEEVADDEDRRPVKKRKLIQGKTPFKKKIKRKGFVSLKTVPETAEGSTHESKPSQSKHQETPGDPEGERTVRKSTRTAVIVRQAERDALRAALQSSMKPIIKRKREGEERRMTQEEMLLEAAQTEIMNLRNLERMLAREEEVKKKAIVHKSVYAGPLISFHSKDGKNTLEFTKVSAFPPDLFSKSVPYPEQLVCVVTGQTAKYRDPKTGLPYATKEAFKIIRERFLEVNKRRDDIDMVEMGPLFSTISGQGFVKKGKRSNACRARSSSCQQKMDELQLQSGERLLSSCVERNESRITAPDVRNDLQVNGESHLSRSPRSSTFLQPNHAESYDLASDAKLFTKERYILTPQAGGSTTTPSVVPVPGPETRQEASLEDLDLGLRLGTNSSKEPMTSSFKNLKL